MANQIGIAIVNWEMRFRSWCVWDCDLFLAMMVSGVSSASECNEFVTDLRVMIICEFDLKLSKSLHLIDFRLVREREGVAVSVVLRSGGIKSCRRVVDNLNFSLTAIYGDVGRSIERSRCI